MPRAEAAACALVTALALADASTENVPAAWLTKVAALPAWLRPLAIPSAFAVPAPVASATAEMLIVPLLSTVAGPVAFWAIAAPEPSALVGPASAVALAGPDAATAAAFAAILIVPLLVRFTAPAVPVAAAPMPAELAEVVLPDVVVPVPALPPPPCLMPAWTIACALCRPVPAAVATAPTSALEPAGLESVKLTVEAAAC